jgi:hypothetical protein
VARSLVHYRDTGSFFSTGQPPEAKGRRQLERSILSEQIGAVKAVQPQLEVAVT